MKRMIEEFLACSVGDVRLVECAQHFMGTDAMPKVDPEVLAARKEMIGSRREADLRVQWDVLYAVVQAEWVKYGRVEIDEARGLALLGDGFDLPFPAPPVIGFHGWHQVDDSTAVVLYPDPYGDQAGAVVDVVRRLDHGRFVIQGGIGIVILEDRWAVAAQLSNGESSPVDVFREMTLNEAMGVDRSLGLLQDVMRHAAAALLAHTLIAADPGIVRESAPLPARLRRANERRGKRTGPGRRWIDLPGLRYDGRNWSADPRTPGGVRWHRVRGTYRLLSSERFVNKRGTRVFVKPHTRGRGEPVRGPGYRTRAG